MMSDRLAPAPRTKRAGRTASHDVAARPADRATRGCPRRSRENPARSASTPTALRLGFATRMVALPAPSSERRAGVADRASGGRVVPVPAEAGTGTSSEHDRGQYEAGCARHRPMTVNVTVAVYRPADTVGRAETNPSLVSQTSPPEALGADVVPTSRSGAGTIGIAGHRAAGEQPSDLPSAGRRPGDAEREVGGLEGRPPDGDGVARGVVAGDGDPFRDRGRRRPRGRIPEADGRSLERDRERRLDVDRRPSRLARRRPWAAASRRTS